VHARALLRLCYSVLDIPQGASVEVARASHRKHMRSLHPDKNPSPEASAVSQALNAAVDVVGNAEMRAQTELLASQAPLDAEVEGAEGEGTSGTPAAANIAGAGAAPGLASLAFGATMKVLAIGGLVASTAIGLGLGTAVGVTAGAATGSLSGFSKSMAASYDHCYTIVPAQTVWLEALDAALSNARAATVNAVHADAEGWKVPERPGDRAGGSGAGLPALSAEWVSPGGLPVSSEPAPDTAAATVAADASPRLSVSVAPFYSPSVAESIRRPRIPPRQSKRGAMGPQAFIAFASAQFDELATEKAAAIHGPTAKEALSELWSDLIVRLKQGLDETDLRWTSHMERDVSQKMLDKWLEIVVRAKATRSSAVTVASVIGTVGPFYSTLQAWKALWTTYMLTQMLVAQLASASEGAGEADADVAAANAASAESAAARSKALVPEVALWRAALLRATGGMQRAALQPLSIRVEVAAEHILTQTTTFPPPHTEAVPGLDAPGPKECASSGASEAASAAPGAAAADGTAPAPAASDAPPPPPPPAASEGWLTASANWLVNSALSTVGLSRAGRVIGPGVDTREIGRGVSGWYDARIVPGVLEVAEEGRINLLVAGDELASVRTTASRLAHSKAERKRADPKTLPPGSVVSVADSATLLLRVVATRLPTFVGQVHAAGPSVPATPVEIIAPRSCVLRIPLP
jgi:hypothetical protein